MNTHPINLAAPNQQARGFILTPSINPEGKPYRFAPLEISGPDNSSTGSIGIACCVTKARAAWNDAARAGWVADLNGKPFAAYYSPAGDPRFNPAKVTT